MSGQLSHNLPVTLTRLLGRERDIGVIAELFLDRSERLVTLTGIGGAGKTRLAIGAGHHMLEAFPDGTRFIALDSVLDERLLLQAVAESLGLSESGGLSLLDGIKHHLSGTRVLLVLDNCEHLVNAIAALALELLSTCRELRILATSREPLQIPGERRYLVEPLRVPGPTSLTLSDELMWYSAVQLFVERVQAVSPNFRLMKENASDVAAICTRLEGIPLAIELTAARVQSLTTAEILHHLDDSFDLPGGIQRGRPARQQTLNATLDWSYQLLTPQEQAVFRRLAVFAAGADLEAIDAVVRGQPAGDAAAASQGKTLDILSRLVEKSLVTVSRSGPRTRYRLLEPIRQYATRLLSADGEHPAASAAHAGHYLAFARAAALGLQGAEQSAWVERVQQDEDNLRLALRWFDEHGQAAALVQLTNALFYYWEFVSRLAEGRTWLQAAIDAARVAPEMVNPQHLGRALHNAGRLAFMQREYPPAATLFDQSVEVFRDLDDRFGIASSQAGLALVASTTLDHDLALSASDEALALAREIGHPALLGFSLLGSGKAAFERGDSDVACARLAEAITMYESVRGKRQLAVGAALLGAAELDARLYERAANHLRHALTTHHVNGDRWFVIFTLINIARLLAETGAPARAARLLGAVRALESELGETAAPIGPRVVEQLVTVLQEELDRDEIDRAVAEGATWLPDDTVALALEAAGQVQRHAAPPQVDVPEPDSVDRLTRREREVAALVARGYSDRQIAEELFISPATVGVHVHHILGKLQIRSRWQVADRLGQQDSPGTPGGDRSTEIQ